MDGHLRLAALTEGLLACSGNPAAVREESQLEDMRSAIRGDFARLAQRRGDQELMRVEPDLEVGDPETAAEEPPEDPASPSRSWLARLFSS